MSIINDSLKQLFEMFGYDENEIEIVTKKFHNEFTKSKPSCLQCKKFKTMECPNSEVCYCVEAKPYFYKREDLK